MTEWYSKAVPGDGSEHLRLSRILDIAQDLKALSVMLAAVGKGTFVIDLAILASNDEEILIGYFYDTSLYHHSARHGGSCHPTVAVRRQEFRCGSAGHRVKDVGSSWHVDLHPFIP